MKFFKYFLLTALIHGMGQCSHAETTDKTIYGNYPSGFYGLRNYVKNPDAEINTDGHTVSGSGATITTVANLDMFNKKQFRVGGNPGNTIVSTVAINTYDRALLDSGKTCITSYWLSISSNGIMTVNMKLDSTVVGTQTIDASVTGVESKRYYILHPCGNTLQVPSLEFSYAVTGGLSTNLFNYDDVHSGFYDGISAVPQGASFYGSVNWAATANCFWSTTSTSYGNFAATAACPTPTVKNSQNVAAPATKVPAIVLKAGSPRGRYVFYGIGSNYKSTGTDASAYLRFSDGTNSSGDQIVTSSNSAIASPVIMGEITYSSYIPVDTTVHIQGKVSTNTIGSNVYASSNAYEIQVVRYPIDGAYDNVYPASLADTNMIWTNGMTITGTGANPTKGVTSTDRIGYALHGIGAWVVGEYKQSATTGSTTGTGDLLLTLPGGLQFADGTTYYTTAIGYSTPWQVPTGIGTAQIANVGNSGSGYVIPYDATRFRIVAIVNNGSTSTTIATLASTGFNLANTAISFSFQFWAPMKGRIPNNGAFVGPGIVVTESKDNQWRKVEGTFSISGGSCLVGPNSTGITSLTKNGTGRCDMVLTTPFPGVSPWMKCNCTYAVFVPGNQPILCHAQQTANNTVVFRISQGTGLTDAPDPVSFDCGGSK